MLKHPSLSQDLLPTGRLLERLSAGPIKTKLFQVMTAPDNLVWAVSKERVEKLVRYRLEAENDPRLLPRKPFSLKGVLEVVKHFLTKSSIKKKRALTARKTTNTPTVNVSASRLSSALGNQVAPKTLVANASVNESVFSRKTHDYSNCSSGLFATITDSKNSKNVPGKSNSAITGTLKHRVSASKNEQQNNVARM